MILISIATTNMSKLLLPRKYLSYSQMTCWRTNKERFRREYFENGRKLNTKYLTFGKSIAKAIEDGTYKDIVPDLNVIGQPEFEVKTLVLGIPVLSFIDTYEAKKHIFQEFKTGKHAWTNTRVQKHEQLVFYATVLKWSTGTMPKKCQLVWLETSEDVADPSDFWATVEKKLSLTGKIVPFVRTFDEREVERMEKLIVKMAHEISEAYKSFISEI
jgi:hypothetical protein